jgi:sugar lactone lactonase YvrE
MRRLALIAAVAGLATLATPAGALARARWDTQVFALVPTPGFPALAFVHPNGRVYEGTYENPAGDTVRSRVLEYTGDGTLLRSWTVRGQDLSAGHGVQVAASDAHGRLILLDKAPARALVLDTRTGRQTRYSTFPDLPLCPALGPATGPCSPARRDEPPMPDYAAWGPDGSLYVTDYQQAVIWRVSPRGGAAQVWLADPRLDGDMFGTAGIVLAADHRTLLFTQASSAGVSAPLLGTLNPSTGKLYAVTAGARPSGLRQVWESRPADTPDGFALGRSGDAYIALVGSNQLVRVAPGGSELDRFPALPLTGDNGSSVPFDNPSSAMFLGTRLMVANESFVAGSRDHQATLDVEAGERGLPVFVPRNAGPRVKRAQRPRSTG